MKTGPIDYALAALGVIQAIMIALWATVVHLSWWWALVPLYIIAGIFAVFLVCFGAFAATMSKWG